MTGDQHSTQEKVLMHLTQLHCYNEVEKVAAQSITLCKQHV